MTPYAPNDLLKALDSLNRPRLLFTPDEASKEERAIIPDVWWQHVALYLSDEQLEKAEKLWKPVYERLPATMEGLWGTLHGLAVLTEEDHDPSLLYIFKGQDGTFYFRRGALPLDQDKIPRKFQKVWDRLPEGVADLYAIHNGWLSDVSSSGGHLAVSNWSFLSDAEWGLEKHVIERMPLPPERIVNVYDQGGGGHLGFELPEEGEDEARGVQFFTNRLAELKHMDFWEGYDLLTALPFSDFAIPGDE